MTVKITTPGALIAALPGVFGFIPQHSLCIVPIKDGLLHCALRIDLKDILPGDREDYIDKLTETVASQNVDYVVGFIVDDDVHCPMCREDHTKLFDDVEWSLTQRGVALRDRVATNMSEWVRGDGEAGLVDTMSPVTARRVFGGGVMHESREAMLATLQPEFGERLMLTPDVEPLSRDAILALGGCEAAGVESVSWSALMVSLADNVLRDAVYSLAVSENASVIEAMFTRLARGLSGEDRRDALTMVAMFAYCRGDGAYAGCALELAGEWGHSRMGAMLDAALQAGFQPEKIRRLAAAGL